MVRTDESENSLSASSSSSSPSGGSDSANSVPPRENQDPTKLTYHANDFPWEELELKYRHQYNLELQRDGREDAIAAPPEMVGAGLAVEAQDNWDQFHMKQGGKFYKAKRYLVEEFSSVLTPSSQSASPVTLLDAGCGYGSALIPILLKLETARGYCFDFSAEAVRIMQEETDQFKLVQDRCTPFVCDMVGDSQALSNAIPDQAVDVMLMIFALSAVLPSQHAAVLDTLKRTLKPGGKVCFRDYGLYDLSMIRSKKQLEKQLFWRGDGTLAHFFSVEGLRDLFQAAGFEVNESNYCTVRLQNRKTGQNMDRVFIHGIFTLRS